MNKNVRTNESNVILGLRNSQMKVEYTSWPKKEELLDQALLMKEISVFQIDGDFRHYRLNNPKNPMPEVLEMANEFYRLKEEIDGTEIIQLGEPEAEVTEEDWWQVFWYKFVNRD